MEDLPFWLKVLSALATPAIALLGGAIAWGQWTTTRSKLILDLFEQRWAVYSKLQDLLGQHTQYGMITSTEYLKAIEQAQFLFGRDVMDFIAEHRNDVTKMSAATNLLKDAERLTPEQQDNAVGMFQDTVVTLTVDFLVPLNKLMIPYMLMDQKRPWTIGRIPRWFGAGWRQCRKA